MWTFWKLDDNYQKRKFVPHFMCQARNKKRLAGKQLDAEKCVEVGMTTFHIVAKKRNHSRKCLSSS